MNKFNDILSIEKMATDSIDRLNWLYEVQAKLEVGLITESEAIQLIL